MRVSEDPRGRRRAMLYRAFALLLVAGGAAYLLMSMQGRKDASDDMQQGSTDATPGAEAGQGAASDRIPASSARPRTAQAPTRGEDISLDLADYIDPDQPVPSTAEIIRKLNEAGIHSGIAAFNPPGTSPPLVGLAVPEDIALPDGYVRHYQSTDDGQDIEPILMFSPDYEFFDAAGKPIPIPENRVVPPEMAPPGVPGRTITVPPPRDPAGP